MLRIIIYTFYCLADTSIATRFVKTDFHLHTLARMLGGVLNQGNRFVSFVRAYARSGCLVTLNLNLCWWSFSLFSVSFGELSLSRVVLRSFHFSLPPPPKPPIQFQFGLSVKNICEFSASTHAHATGRHYTTIQRSGVDACEKWLR